MIGQKAITDRQGYVKNITPAFLMIALSTRRANMTRESDRYSILSASGSRPKARHT